MAKVSYGTNFEKLKIMRSFFVMLLVFGCNVLQAQMTKTGGPVKIKHEALEMRGEDAYYKGKPFTGLSFTFWENNRISEQYSWKDGKKDGEYKEFTKDGILVTMITFSAGEKHGPYTYNYFTGAKQSEGQFYYGELDGVVLGYYSTGIQKYSVTYTRGVRNGESRTWFKNGAPEQIAFYVNDLPHGDVFEYYQDSLLWSESEYNMGMRHGRYYQFHRKSGCPAVESYFKNGKLDSIRRIWNEINCQLIEEEHYLLGKKHGQFVLYDLTGDTLSVTNYDNGELHGEYLQYYSKTTPETDGGIVMAYKDHRGVEISGNYNHGKKDGFWKYGLMSHYQHREGEYDDDNMVGEWKFYDTKGRILMIQWYAEDGTFLKEKRYRRPRKQ